MSRLRNLLKAIASGGVHCPFCDVPSPHRPWYCIREGGCKHEIHQNVPIIHDGYR